MNLYAIPPLVTSILALFLGFLTFRSVKPKVRYSFPLVAIAVFTWLFGYFLAYSTTEHDIALKWIRILYIGVVFIPAASYHFTVSFLDLRRKAKFIAAAYLISAGFAILIRNESFIAGAYKYYWGYQAKAGPLHNIFLAFFSIVMGRVIVLLLSQYRKNKRESLPLQSNRIKYVLISFFASTFAVMDFLPNYGVEFYPLGFICISFHAIMSTYAIVKYKIMDINVALARAGIFALVYALVLGLPFWIGSMFKETFSKMTSNWWLIPVSLMAVLASAGPFIYMRIQKRFESRIRAEEFKSHEALRRLSHSMLRFTNLEVLLKLVVHYIVKILRLKFAAIYLFDGQIDKYVLKSFWQLGEHIKPPMEFSKNSPLLRDLYLRRVPIVTEELKLSSPQVFSSHIKGLLNTLTNLKANTVIPSFLRNELLGFLILSDKETNLAFTQEDLNLLMVLSNEAALAIENAQFHDKEKFRLVEKSRRDALADMAPGAGHQFNNRLVAISSSVELLLLKLENIKLDNLSNEADKAIIDDAKVMLESIDKEVYKGKEITSAILKQAKAKVDFQELDIQSLIENTHKLILISRSKGGTENFQEPKFKLTLLNEMPLIFASEALLQDSFYNLLDNSFDAIQEKSRLISNGELPLTKDLTFQGEIDITLKQEDQTLVIELKDNGIGIKKENQRRLFVPYFTTKATSGKGSGIGLYVIRDFIERHHGTITCDSEYGEGITFTIRLPLNRNNSIKK